MRQVVRIIWQIIDLANVARVRDYRPQLLGAFR
jgi:hypothetical protein